VAALGLQHTVLADSPVEVSCCGGCVSLLDGQGVIHRLEAHTGLTQTNVVYA